MYEKNAQKYIRTQCTDKDNNVILKPQRRGQCITTPHNTRNDIKENAFFFDRYKDLCACVCTSRRHHRQTDTRVKEKRECERGGGKKQPEKGSDQCRRSGENGSAGAQASATPINRAAFN